MNNEYPCHKLPKEQWCDYDGAGGFMGHTCVERNIVGAGRNVITDIEIAESIASINEKINMRLLQKHRGSFIGNHETYGILAEEFKELLDALHKNDNQDFYCELIDIAVGAILGMASMRANNSSNNHMS